jgi:transcriptional regulator with XRE-family HTH domain
MSPLQTAPHGNPLKDGRAIRLARSILGLSQRELALAAGLTSIRVWKLENGVSQPTAEELARLWGALSTTSK